jgi:hypothetical protein
VPQLKIVAASQIGPCAGEHIAHALPMCDPKGSKWAQLRHVFEVRQDFPKC